MSHGVSIVDRPVTMSQTTANALARLLKSVLEQCPELQLPDGKGGQWKVRAVHQTRMRTESRLHVRHFNGTAVSVKLRPGGNDSCWEVSVTPPAGLSNLLVGRILTLWNGWTGNGGPPDAYLANLKAGMNDAERADDPELTPEQEPRLDQPATSPPVDVVELFGRLQATVQRTRETERQIATLQNKQTELLSQADNLYQAAEELESAIADLQRDLESPETKTALAVVKQFSALLGQGSCSAK